LDCAIGLFPLPCNSNVLSNLVPFIIFTFPNTCIYFLFTFLTNYEFHDYYYHHCLRHHHLHYHWQKSHF
jgi:hypothetical protein